MTDGTGSGGSTGPWWSDGQNDPWRNPGAQTVIVQRTEPPAPPPVEPALDAAPQRPVHGMRLVVTVAVVSALLAGVLGGAVGYVAAVEHASPSVVIGATAPVPQRPATSVAGLVARVMPSVVTVQGPTTQGESLGSGFVIAADGYILTNEHVVTDVADNAVTVIFSDASTAAGTVVGRDPESDVAVIKVDRTGLTPVELGDSDQVAVGDPVLAIGSPLALTDTVTAGIVSALDRTIETQDAGGSPATTRRSRPTPRSTTATPAARCSTRPAG